jgi:hypothetical protein
VNGESIFYLHASENPRDNPKGFAILVKGSSGYQNMTLIQKILSILLVDVDGF